ncbi:hypothetical protein F7734_52845 [Scytonema sp. UIC 10036]|uniref:hypothetical protein n=1 Tax=Scytonema sp. UIC 10036 TaxID=2304196 RepID=UPI0012DA4095|nr:hypothetical protein [Scytonema sp. UIC 10036]MUH00504.1 hypothetical protein [Scytonema sp. UIC 10036]
MRDNSNSWLSLQWLTTFLGTLATTQLFNLLQQLNLMPQYAVRVVLISLAIMAVSYWFIWAYNGVNLANPKAKNLLYYGVPFVGLFAFLLGLT